MKPTQPIFRFAPSPNGYLHLGHAYSALLNLKMAREIGGKCLLRIEDIDTARCTPELEAQMLTDLEWIGFEWDEEPVRQSDNFKQYESELAKLKMKELVYPSLLSRGEIKKLIAIKSELSNPWPTDPDGSAIYPGKERELSAEEKKSIFNGDQAYAIRLDTARAVNTLDDALIWNEVDTEVDPNIWGDVILARKDTPTSYHLSCVVDDAAQGVTHVVRGLDLYQATSIHILLQKLLGFSQPIYHHHKLILDDTRQKLSKSTQSVGIANLRESGRSPSDIHEMLFSNG